MESSRGRKFLDSLRVHVKSGNGGAGNASIGGVGGKGGSVIFQGKAGVTLSQLMRRNPQRRFVAGHGSPSARRCLLGRPGADKVVGVPLGVRLLTDDRTSIGCIDEVGDKVVVARGGAGGCARNRFLGSHGRALSVRIDLRLLADFGFVGFPNAGKSTLMSALSKNKPKVSNFPFTTLRPSIGQLQFTDQRSIALADLPGLIEGAHINVGLGHHFLKHVERTTFLLFIVDVFGFRLNSQSPFRNAIETVALLNRELELYNEELAHKPSLLVLNKIDKSEGRSNAQQIQDDMQDYTRALQSLPKELQPQTPVNFSEIISISAKDKINTEFLKQRLRYWLDHHQQQVTKVELITAQRQLEQEMAADEKESVASFV